MTPYWAFVPVGRVALHRIGFYVGVRGLSGDKPGNALEKTPLRPLCAGHAICNFAEEAPPMEPDGK